jgi:hypothetical protein
VSPAEDEGSEAQAPKKPGGGAVVALAALAALAAGVI